MKGFIKQVFRFLRGPLDVVLSIVVIPAAYLLLLYRRIGAARLPAVTRQLRRIGVFPIRNHYYEPLFDGDALEQALGRARSLPGLDLRSAGQLELLRSLDRATELLSMELLRDPDPTDVAAFSLKNPSFVAGDAEFLYQLIRHLKPRRVVEIGSGNSTKIARLALQRNRSETGVAADHVCIEPYEQPWLERLGDVKVVRRKLEDCGLDWSRELGPGDLLFVDSSHMIRPGGDVLMEYLEIFPVLQPGVVVHVHDIFTPRDYPRVWLLDEVRFWNEQYLLEALLTDSPRYEVVAALNHLKHEHFAELQRVCPYLTASSDPGSFYFRVVGPAAPVGS